MNDIIKELELMNKLAADIFPKPTYFYVQRYGRDLRADITKLTEAMGQKQYFIFDKLTCVANKSNIEAYEILLEKNKPLGQSYEGCVLIDFTEIKSDEQLENFVEYLSTQTKQQHYIFTMKESENTVSIQNVLERYFFMRKIEAKPYSVEEQSEIFSAVLEQYASSGIKLYWQEGSEERINACLRKCIWKTQDSVSFRLKNAISAVLYEKIIEARSTEIVIDEEFVEQTFSGLKEKKEQKRQIGFTMGGFDYE